MKSGDELRFYRLDSFYKREKVRYSEGKDYCRDQIADVSILRLTLTRRTTEEIAPAAGCDTDVGDGEVMAAGLLCHALFVIQVEVAHISGALSSETGQKWYSHTIDRQHPLVDIDHRRTQAEIAGSHGLDYPSRPA